MDCEPMPKFSEDSLEELTRMLVKFFQKNLPGENLSNIEVEIKVKPSSQDNQALDNQALRQKAQTIVIGGCREGEGAGCGIGFRWAMARVNEMEE